MSGRKTVDPTKDLLMLSSLTHATFTYFVSLGLPYSTKTLGNQIELSDFLLQRRIGWLNQMGAIREHNDGNIGSTTDAYCVSLVLRVGVNIEIFVLKTELVKLRPRAHAIPTPIGTVHADH